MNPTPLVWIRAAAICLILAPLLQVLEALLSPLTGDTAAQLDAIAAHQGSFVTSVLLGLAATVLYVPAFIGLAHSTAARSPVLSLVAALLAVGSMVAFGGVRAVQAVQLELVRSDIDRGQAVALLDAGGQNPLMAAVLATFLGGMLFGLITLVVAVWRSRRFPRTPAVLIVGFLIFDLFGVPLGGSVDPGMLPVISHLVFLAGLGWLGFEILRQTRTPQVTDSQQPATLLAG